MLCLAEENEGKCDITEQPSLSVTFPGLQNCPPTHLNWPQLRCSLIILNLSDHMFY